MGLRIFYILKKLLGIDYVLKIDSSGLKLLIDITDWVQYQIYFYGNYERQSVSLFKNLAVNSKVVFDIGSHIGQYALECALEDRDKEKSIFAIEANPKTFTYLLNNIQLNSFTQVYPILGAVTPNHEIATIEFPNYWNLGNTQLSKQTKKRDLNSYLISTFNIKTILKLYKIKEIDLMKIDIEGYEYGFFKDLFNDKIYPKNILFECVPSIFPDALRLKELLVENQYLIKDILGNTYIDGVKILEENLWATKI
jgi:FkbM family methyltransferase